VYRDGVGDKVDQEEREIHESDPDLVGLERLDRQHPNAEVRLEEVVDNEYQTECGHHDDGAQQYAQTEVPPAGKDTTLAQVQTVLTTKGEVVDDHECDGNQAVHRGPQSDEERWRLRKELGLEWASNRG